MDVYNERMMASLERIGVRAVYDADSDVIRFGYAADEGRIDVSVAAEADVVQFWTTTGLEVPADRRVEVGRWVNALNVRMKLGGWRVSPTYGDVTFHVAVPYAEAFPDDATLERCRAVGVEMVQMGDAPVRAVALNGLDVTVVLEGMGL